MANERVHLLSPLMTVSVPPNENKISYREARLSWSKSALRRAMFSPTRFLQPAPFSPSALPDLIAPMGASDFRQLAKLFDLFTYSRPVFHFAAMTALPQS